METEDLRTKRLDCSETAKIGTNRILLLEVVVGLASLDEPGTSRGFYGLAETSVNLEREGYGYDGEKKGG